jgi:hypothetical protein
MRKTAGFLLVLFLATLVVITNSYGDGDDDSSHVVHLSDPYGPEIPVCDDCHPIPFFGSFADDPPKNLEYTEVCDPCHSPGGAYDGVVSTLGSVGAKDNWSKAEAPFDNNSSNIYSGADFQPGKEKWCVGCHDGGSSVINSVSAPDIAGNDIDYGYYKTGHG